AAPLVGLRKIVVWTFRYLLKQTADDRFRLLLDRRILLQYCAFCRCEQAVKASKDRERQNYLAIFVPLVRAPEEIADAPNEASELGMRLSGHPLGRLPKLF